MFDYREHFITIAAIFLALALGILIGVSFGENFLVSNQRRIIELLEQEITRRNNMIAEKKRALDYWEQLKPLIFRAYQDTLTGNSIIVVSEDEDRAAEIWTLLKKTGAQVRIAGVDEVLALVLAEENLPVGDGARAGLPYCYILLMEGVPFDAPDIYELWQLLQREEKRVIAAYPWSGDETRAIPTGGERCGVVDNIDTFWGKVSMLEMVVFGAGGDYGFGSERRGLIPLQEEYR